MTDKKASGENAGEGKIRVGWFTFSCCEDNTIVMTEIMNDHWQEWKKLFDFRHARVLKRHNVLDRLDVAFVEGALASDDHVAQLKDIRERSTLLVAIGSCACTGMPSAQRNMFSEEQKEDVAEEIEFMKARFGGLDKVLKLSDVVKVDLQVPGCPMSPQNFLKAVDQAIAVLKGGAAGS